MSEEFQSAEAAPVDTVPAPSEPSPDAPADNIGNSMEAVYDAAEARNGEYRKPPEYKPDAPPSESDKGAPDGLEEYEKLEKKAAMPQSWGKHIMEHWDGLPDTVKDEIARREQDVARFVSQHSTNLRSAQQSQQQLEAVNQRFAETLPRVNGQPMPTHEVYARMIAANDALERNPREALAYLAQSYGIDLAELRPPSDPVETARQQERQALQTQLQQVEQQRYAATRRVITDHVERFAAERAAHWPQIENDVLYHIGALRALHPEMDSRDVLEQAYAKAVASRPDLDPNKKAEAKKRADEARRIQSMNVKSIGNAARRAGTNWQDDLGRIYDQIAGRRT